MSEMFMRCLLVCPLVFLAGFVDAVAGGGGLISLPAYMLSGLPVPFALGTNKLSSCMGTALATYRYGRSGYINWKRALPCVVTALIGSWAGARLALLINESVFKILMLIILPLVALYVLRGKGLVTEKQPFEDVKTLILCLITALVVGTYDGFYGPGTGTFLLLLLTGMARVTLHEAAGTTKVINLTSNVTAVTVFLTNGNVLIPLGLIAGVFSIAGNWLGTRMFARKGVKFVKPLILIVLVIFFIKICTEVF